MKKFRFMVKMHDQLTGYLTPWADAEGETLKETGSKLQDIFNESDIWFGFVDVDGYRIVRRDDVEFILLQEGEFDDD